MHSLLLELNFLSESLKVCLPTVKGKAGGHWYKLGQEALLINCHSWLCNRSNYRFRSC